MLKVCIAVIGAEPSEQCFVALFRRWLNSFLDVSPVAHEAALATGLITVVIEGAFGRP